MKIEMPRLLLLPNGSAVDPAMIHVVKGVEGKCVIIRNEFNKMIELMRYPLLEDQVIIVAEIQKVQRQGEDWVQPDWNALLAKATSQTPAKTTKAAA